MKTLILGLGNTILSDDGVGIRVVEELQSRLSDPDITVLETNVSGLSLLDIMIGYDKVIIVDAIQTVGGKPGDIYQLTPDALKVSRHAASPHDVNLVTALDLGKKLGLSMPQEIVIFAIEVADVTTFSEECTPELKPVIPVCVETVIRELKEKPNA
jgi:hydrogenase maturation protease